MTLTPAYGRDYKSKAEVIWAFREGRDFECFTPSRSGKINIQEIPVGTQVSLRYLKLTMQVLYTVTQNDKTK